VREAFLDTNLFIRYLTNDDEEKANRVALLLREAAEGNVQLVTTELVLAEVIWVLESTYKLERPRVAALVLGILATPGLEVINSSLVARAMEFYEAKGIDFVDGYVAATMERRGIEEIYSFDRKHLDRLNTVKRREP
jgi:predicted nucleic-acid-binding protein